MAECSESTGTSWPGFAVRSTSDPPATSDSLLASARRAPDSSAARVAPRPIDPTRALSTTSDSTSRTSRSAASGPDDTAASMDAAADGSAQATRSNDTP